MTSRKIILLFALIALPFNWAQSLVSPCPSLFSYEPFHPNDGVWFGNINLRSNSELSGVWIRIILDKLPVQFNTNFGIAVQKEASEFLIRNPKNKVNNGDVLQYRINATFIPGEDPPKLVSFRLNGKTICPDDGKSEAKPASAPIAGTPPSYESPCPDKFKYESFESDRYTATISYRSDLVFSDIWMRVIFDKQPSEILTDFGVADKFERTDYLIKRPSYALNVGDLLQFPITVRFNPGSAPPKFIGFRINASPICNGVIETTQKPRPQSLTEILKSPCPEVFHYETFPEHDKWSAYLDFVSDIDLEEVRIIITLDRPALILSNWFGEATTEDNVLFVISKSNYKVKIGDRIKFKIILKFDIDAPPTIKEIKVNSRLICPIIAPSRNNIGKSLTNHYLTSPTDQVTLSPTKQTTINEPNIVIDFNPNRVTTFGIPKPEHSAKVECGVVASKPVPLITNGIHTDEGNWPWHAALYYQSGSTFEYYCGGSLISLKHVLTAAHCVAVRKTATPLHSEEIHVFLGKYYLTKSNAGVQQRQVKEIYIYPNYNSARFNDDVALLVLTTPAEYTEWVRPVCLWSGSADINNIENQHGTVVGWGYNNYGDTSDKLLKAVMPVVSDKTCISSNKKFFDFALNGNNFCAGFRNGTSVCTGDSGGGLVFPVNNPNKKVWEIVGIVSISVAIQAKYNNATSLCDTSQFTVFTDVTKFLGWIKPFVNTQ